MKRLVKSVLEKVRVWTPKQWAMAVLGVMLAFVVVAALVGCV